MYVHVACAVLSCCLFVMCRMCMLGLLSAAVRRKRLPIAEPRAQEHRDQSPAESSLEQICPPRPRAQSTEHSQSPEASRAQYIMY